MESITNSEILENLLGSIRVSKKGDDAKKFEILLANLRVSSFEAASKQARQTFEKSDVYSRKTFTSNVRMAIDDISRERESSGVKEKYIVYKREQPVISSLLDGAQPKWANGVKPQESIGPFIQADKRQVWFDFYAVIKFSKLFFDGESSPALLYKSLNITKLAAKEIKRVAEKARLLKDGPDKISAVRTKPNTISLGKGTIWVRSKHLANGAPENTYTGLTISGGTITLNKKPLKTIGSYVVSGSTTVTVDLQLDQPNVVIPKAKDRFGGDARDMKLNLSKGIRFHFTKINNGLDEVENASWRLFDHQMGFTWGKSAAIYRADLSQILIPLKSKPQNVTAQKSNSELLKVAGKANISNSYWALPVAEIDISKPSAAAGIGGLLLECKKGLEARWSTLKGSAFALQKPLIFGLPDSLFMMDAGINNELAVQKLDLWPDDSAGFMNSVELSFKKKNTLVLGWSVDGTEIIQTLANAKFDIDRPVRVNGLPPKVQSVNSLMLMSVSRSVKLIYLLDNNMLQDLMDLNPNNQEVLQSMSFALRNGLFRVTPPNGCILFGSLSNDFLSVVQGNLFITFGLQHYLPTLPDPYAANLGALRRSPTIDYRRDVATRSYNYITAIQNWLVCRTQWEYDIEAIEDAKVEVSFHLVFGGTQFSGINLQQEAEEEQQPKSRQAVGTIDNNILATKGTAYRATVARNYVDSSYENYANELGDSEVETMLYAAAVADNRLPDYEGVWDEATQHLRRENFALLDVSSNADLLGISFDLTRSRQSTALTHATTGATGIPLAIEGMDVISTGSNVKTFTVPQISWEPLINLTPPDVNGDPPAGFNYYPNDGGPTRILNNGQDSVALAPIPLTDYLFQHFENDTNGFTAKSLMTLPFGLKALAVLQNQYIGRDKNGNPIPRKGSDFLRNSEKFENEIRGSRQIQLNAGEAFINGESDMFVGSTIQTNNVLDFTGNGDGDSTLGKTVTEIFNDEFLLEPYDPERQRGVPLTRIDLSGYGASSFSNWLNPTAAFAATSQAKFDIMVGRCAHEIIQVKSIIYPWGIKVVRTITIFRVGSGYVYRFDSGWRAESNGNFDFRYFVNLDPQNKTEMDSPFEIHPGIIKGLYNVQNIEETEEIAFESGQMVSPKIVNGDGLYVDNPDAQDLLNYRLQPVYFDADIEVENSVAGFVEKTIDGSKKNVVSSKKIVGYVQSAPRGIPITPAILRGLVNVQLGNIGGGIDCEVDLAKSSQKMRLNRFDFTNSVGSNGTDVVFAVCARGSVMLPKDGAWSMVKHEASSGEVSPVPASLSIPVIREGKVVRKNDLEVKVDKTPAQALIRLAEPRELLHAPTENTVNYGFLQSTDTQKALFLTPSFELNQTRLFSKTPALFVDAFRIVNSKSIFPNIGDAVNNFGEAIELKKGSPFPAGSLNDLGETIRGYMDISDTIDNAKQQAFQLIKNANDQFDLPPTEFELINIDEGSFRIYIEYKNAPQVPEGDDQPADGKLDFDINSLANDVADTWKSRMGNIGLVIDLAGIDRLMTIRGSWDSAKGGEPSYPQPKIEFAPELEPIIEILEILQKIQKQDYAGAVAGGLKLAMSNKAGSWEYKFEASKEIPVLRFPPLDAAYNDPNCPFKLEAGLKLGAYFNAALEVNTKGGELKPSAGGMLGFYGRLSVMCVSISAATVYAIGQVNLDIAADTAIGPSLAMKFGFGAQIVVGLPVAGNVSVLFVVGVEIYAAQGIIEVSGFLLFEGHAEILGGIVSITIRIEAKGTVSKKTLPGGDSRTDMACQVTFGLDISIAFIINISFSESWQEQRQIA